MIKGLEQARIHVDICEDILLSAPIRGQRAGTPELEQAYDDAVTSIKNLYFMISETINMRRRIDSQVE